MANASKLNESLFGDELKTLYRILKKAHEKYETNITTAELIMLWKVQHPVATRAFTEDLQMREHAIVERKLFLLIAQYAHCVPSP